MSRLFAFGLGFSAQALAERLASQGWRIAGTARDPANVAPLAAKNYAVTRFAGAPGNAALPKLLQDTTHLLLSIPPGPEGDPVLAHYREQLTALSSLRWVGYLSTVGVYGDQDGNWVDESTAPKPNSPRTEAR
ncbi:MAG: NAD(P)-dependent oxidoreductase, partial [Methyloceanibacter sp.]